MRRLLRALVAVGAAGHLVVTEQDCPHVQPNFSEDLCGDAVGVAAAVGLPSAHAANSLLASADTMRSASQPRPAASADPAAKERFAALLAKPRRLNGIRRQFLTWSEDSAARGARAALLAAGWKRPTSRTVVWELLSYVGVGNALDAYARATMEALYGGHELVVRCPIVGKLCAILDCALMPVPKNHSVKWVGPKKYAEPSGRPVAKFIDDFMFKWRFGRVDDEYAEFLELLYGVLGCTEEPRKLRLACARSRLLRDVVRGPLGPLLGATRETLRSGFVGSNVNFDAVLDKGGVGPAPYDVALHLRTLDFIEGSNASRRGDGAALDWLSSAGASVGWQCLERRLRALNFGTCGRRSLYVAADNPATKRGFAAAVQAAFPGASVDYFDGLKPPHFSKWFAPVSGSGALKPRDWWSLVGAAADWCRFPRVFGRGRGFDGMRIIIGTSSRRPPRSSASRAPRARPLASCRPPLHGLLRCTRASSSSTSSPARPLRNGWRRSRQLAFRAASGSRTAGGKEAHCREGSSSHHRR